MRIRFSKRAKASRRAAALAWILSASAAAGLPGGTVALANGSDTTAATAGSSSVERYASELGSADADRRLAAVRGLAALGPAAAPAVPKLADVVLDPDPRVRLAMIETLGGLGVRARAAAPSLVPLLRHEDPATQRAAAVALGDIGAPSSTDALIEALLDEAPEVRAAAATALGKYGTAAKLAIPRLAKLSQDSDPTVRAAAAQALPKVGPRKNRVAFLAVDLKAPAAEKRRRTAMALGELGREATATVPTLRRLTRDPDEKVRFAAANALLAIAPDSVSVAPALVALVADPGADRTRRARLVLEMDKAGMRSAGAIPSLIQQLRSKEMLERKSAALMLGRVHPTNDEAVAALVGALQSDPATDVRGVAADALGNLGVDAKAAIPALEEAMMHDANQDVRTLAAGALYRVKRD